MSAAADDTPGRAARRRAASMYDVARLAGVSHQTVSRVVNGSQQVREETRDRVLAAMEQLTTGRTRLREPSSPAGLARSAW
jgi:hypothetical protein